MMVLLRTLRWFSIVLISLTAWLTMTGTALAQRGMPSPVEKRYVFQYVGVVLGIGLVLMLVLRSVGRSKDIKPKHDD